MEGKLKKYPLSCPECNASIEPVSDSFPQMITCAHCGRTTRYDLEYDGNGIIVKGNLIHNTIGQQFTGDVYFAASEEDLLRQGLDHLRLNNTSGAQTSFEEVVQRFPNSYRGWLGLWIVTSSETHKNNVLSTCPEKVRRMLGSMPRYDDYSVTRLMNENSWEQKQISEYQKRIDDRFAQHKASKESRLSTFDSTTKTWEEGYWQECQKALRERKEYDKECRKFRFKIFIAVFVFLLGIAITLFGPVYVAWKGGDLEAAIPVFGGPLISFCAYKIAKKIETNYKWFKDHNSHRGGARTKRRIVKDYQYKVRKLREDRKQEKRRIQSIDPVMEARQAGNAIEVDEQRISECNSRVQKNNEQIRQLNQFRNYDAQFYTNILKTLV